MNRKYRDMQERLIANSVVDPVKGCWVWLRRCGNSRCGRVYGLINLRVNGVHKTELAHRVAYREFKGPIEDWASIDHECENTLCVNPDHLAVVTQERNIALYHERRTV